MADLGLLAGLAKGLNAGVESYFTERDYQDRKRKDADEKALKDRMQRAELASKGYDLQVDGSITRTAEQREKDALARAEKLAAIRAKGLIPKFNQETNSYELDRDPNYVDDDKEYKKLRTAIAKRTLETKAKSNQIESDPFKIAPRATQMEGEKIIDKQVKRQAALAELDAALQQLQDPKKSEDEKVMIGQMLLKKLNDPEVSDAVAKEEVERLGAYLELFSLVRPGSTFGRDIPRFIAQVKNKRELIGKAYDSGQSRLGELGLLGANQNQPNGLLPKPVDAQAIEWARANPNDPRSAQILKVNGVLK